MVAMFAACGLELERPAYASGTAQPDPGQGVRQPEEVRYIPGEIVVFPHDPLDTPAIVERLKAQEFLVLGTAPMSGMVLAATVPVPGIEELVCRLIEEWPEVKAAERNIGGDMLGARQPCEYGTCTKDRCELPYPYEQVIACGTPPSGHPNDPAFCRQWGLHNIGQEIEDRTFWDWESCCNQTAVPTIDINLLEAWQITTGSDQVTVAVFDTGVEYCNPDFDPSRIITPGLSLTCQGNDGPMYPCAASDPIIYGPATDNFGHGTIVASIIGATSDNEVGMTGIDQHCKILPGRIMSASEGSGPNLARLIIALETVGEEEHESVRVINISWRFPYIAPNPDPNAQMVALESAVNALAYANKFVIVGSGNFGEYITADDSVPQRFSQVFTVGGIDSEGWRFEHPLSGTLSTPPIGTHASAIGDCLDFMAPGMAEVGLICQFLGCNTNPSPSCPYQQFPCEYAHGNFVSGTSFAAPKVAAAVSLILARAIELEIVVPESGWSGLTWSDMYEILQAGCRDRISWINYPTVSGDDDDDFGWDPYYGWGLIDIAASLEYLEANFCCP